MYSSKLAQQQHHKKYINTLTRKYNLVYSELGNFDYARSKSKRSYTNLGLKDETKTEYIVLALYYHFKKT